MKRSLLFALAATMFVACQKERSMDLVDEIFVVTGNCDVESRTAFGTPSSSEIPYRWSAGDYIWLGNNKSSAIAEECTLAQFEFRGGTAIVGIGHVFYNMTGQAKSAKVTSDMPCWMSTTRSTWSTRLRMFGSIPRVMTRICQSSYRLHLRARA